MIYPAKDPSLGTLLRQTGLQAAGFDPGPLDNWPGARTEAAWQAWKSSFLLGDGTWNWCARVDGLDIVLEDVSMTWFGGDHDPLDNGETASGIRTKGNPDLLGVALPVIPGHSSTKGSPLAFGERSSLRPGIPWHTSVAVVRGSSRFVVPLIDNGPARSAADPADATVKLFTNLGGRLSEGVLRGVTIRILGAAKYARA
ncbi:hypothetical protein BH20VER3_BH20VER3_00860 [soil metagenome]